MKIFLKNLVSFCFLALALPGALLGQYPQGSHTNIYFPHLVDGGPPAQQWQTTFIFLNPGMVVARVTLQLFDDNGRPLALDLGLGVRSEMAFSIPPSGTRILRSNMASARIVGGWAIALADTPVQATCLFRAIENGVHRLELSAPPAVPSQSYTSFATAQLGVALANIYTDGPIAFKITAYESEGRIAGATMLILPPKGHTAFNLDQRMAGLPNAYSGRVLIEPVEPTDRFLAWTLNVDRGLVATLPSGAQTWPVSHWDEAWMAFLRTWQAMLLLADSGSEFAYLKTLSVPKFSVMTEFQGQRLNAFANGQEIVVTYGLAELISDSPSELGWIIAHEMGHVIQRQSGLREFDSTNAEFDADTWGFLLSLLAGYDPYAAAGALSKLAMITGRAGLVQQFEDQLSSDAHKSFNTRLDLIYETMQAVCSIAPAACKEYKDLVHPHFPSQAPLSLPDPPTPVRDAQIRPGPPND